MVCIRCQKRPAIIFIQRMENGQMKQEGYCLHCARELHIKPVDDLMKQFGMSEQDLDNMENRMESMMEELGDSNPLSMLMNMSGSGEDADAENMDEDLVPGSNATFPLGFTGAEKQDGEKKADRKNGKKPPKRKFLETYCENLTRKAREGKLDDINEALHINLESEDYDSIGGYIIEQLDCLPKEGQSVTLESGIRLVVDRLDKNRIELVHIWLPEKKTETEEQP